MILPSITQSISRGRSLIGETSAPSPLLPSSSSALSVLSSRTRSVQIVETSTPRTPRILYDAPYTEVPDEIEKQLEAGLLPGENEWRAAERENNSDNRSETLEQLGSETKRTIGRRTRRGTTVLPASPNEQEPRWPYSRPTLTRGISSVTACLTPMAMASEDDTDDLEHIWYTYAREAAQFDQQMISTWNRSLEVSVLSAGIFSAILTPFVTESYTLLQTVHNPSPRFFGTNGYAIRVNAAWFGSLALSLIAALLSIHFRQWVEGYGAQEFFAGNTDSAANVWRACRMRQYRYQNIQRYYVPQLISLLPVLLYTAIALFAIGLIDFLWHLNWGISIFVAILCGNTAVFHVVTTVVPFFTTRSPFRTPLSNLLSNLCRGLCQGRFAVRGLYEAAEMKDIQTRGHVLDQKGLEWLMKHTHSEEIFQDALRAKYTHIRVVQKSKLAMGAPNSSPV